MRRTSLWLVLALVAGAFSALAASPAVALDPPVCETFSAGAVVPQEECTATGTVGSVAEKTFEPTMGAGPDGNLYFSTTPGSGLLVGFGASTAKSADGGQTWSDIGPRVAGQRVPLETNDPYIYVDPSTGRIFQFHMEPILACSALSYSDDGGQTWTNNPLGCGPTGAYDHQTLVAAKPRVLVPTTDYPNILHACVNAVTAETCSHSLDGGLTWTPMAPAWPNEHATQLCGTQTGHLAAAPDGTLYLPTSICGTYPTVAVSRDDGLTWTRVKVADIPMAFEDPAVAVDADGVAYVAFNDENGQLYFSTSRNAGATWSAPLTMTSDQVTSGKLAMTVGDSGKIALAFVGTGGIPGQMSGKTDLDNPAAVRWGAFITTSLDALSPTPTFTTLEVTGTDPLFNNANGCGPGYRCAYIVDFIEATVTPDGRPYGAFVDGCTEKCSTEVGAQNNRPGNAGLGLVASVDVDLCEARCAQFGPAPAQPPAPTKPVPPGTGPAGPTPVPGQSAVPGMDLATFEALRQQETDGRF